MPQHILIITMISYYSAVTCIFVPNCGHGGRINSKWIHVAGYYPCFLCEKHKCCPIPSHLTNLLWSGRYIIIVIATGNDFFFLKREKMVQNLTTWDIFSTNAAKDKIVIINCQMLQLPNGEIECKPLSLLTNCKVITILQSQNTPLYWTRISHMHSRCTLTHSLHWPTYIGLHSSVYYSW